MACICPTHLRRWADKLEREALMFKPNSFQRAAYFSKAHTLRAAADILSRKSTPMIDEQDIDLVGTEDLKTARRG